MTGITGCRIIIHVGRGTTVLYAQVVGPDTDCILPMSTKTHGLAIEL